MGLDITGIHACVFQETEQFGAFFIIACAAGYH
jgi:hypothetical protein